MPKNFSIPNMALKYLKGMTCSFSYVFSGRINEEVKYRQMNDHHGYEKKRKYYIIEDLKTNDI